MREYSIATGHIKIVLNGKQKPCVCMGEFIDYESLIYKNSERYLLHNGKPFIEFRTLSLDVVNYTFFFHFFFQLS